MQKIDLRKVQAGDIIVTREKSLQSKLIRVGTCSSYSHAILALGNSMCIEAVPGKPIKKTSLKIH